MKKILSKLKLPKIKFSRKFFRSKKFLIGVAVASVITIGGIVIGSGPGRPSIHQIAANNVAEARFFMKYAHAGDMCVHFSVGRREEPFNRDGVANPSVNFAILNVEGDATLREMEQIEGTIRIAGNQYNFTLLQNPYNALQFTNDIIRNITTTVTPTCTVEVTLMLATNNHPTLQLKNPMAEDAVTWEQALRAATEKIGHKIKGQQFETHVTIMHSVANSGAFWYIQFITDKGEIHFSVVAPDGSVIG